MAFTIAGPTIKPVHKYAIGGVFEHGSGGIFYKIVKLHPEGYSILTGEHTLQAAYDRADGSRLANDGVTPFDTIKRFRYYPPLNKRDDFKETEYIQL